MTSIAFVEMNLPSLSGDTIDSSFVRLVKNLVLDRITSLRWICWDWNSDEFGGVSTV